MPIFTLNNDLCLGMSHSGSVYCNVEGSVSLTDEQTQQLVQLIRENNGNSDVEELDLKDKYPEIYNILDKACEEASLKSEEKFWLIHGYENDYFDRRDDFEEQAEKAGFEFDNPEEGVDEEEWMDAKEELMTEFVENYILGDYNRIYDFYEVDIDLEDVNHYVFIPEDIIKMAKE